MLVQEHHPSCWLTSDQLLTFLLSHLSYYSCEQSFLKLTFVGPRQKTGEPLMAQLMDPHHLLLLVPLLPCIIDTHPLALPRSPYRSISLANAIGSPCVHTYIDC